MHYLIVGDDIFLDDMHIIDYTISFTILFRFLIFLTIMDTSTLKVHVADDILVFLPQTLFMWNSLVDYGS